MGRKRRFPKRCTRRRGRPVPGCWSSGRQRNGRMCCWGRPRTCTPRDRSRASRCGTACCGSWVNRRTAAGGSRASPRRCWRRCGRSGCWASRCGRRKARPCRWWKRRNGSSARSGQSRGVPVRLNGVWLNLLRATATETPASMQLSAAGRAPGGQSAHRRLRAGGLSRHGAARGGHREQPRGDPHGQGNLFGYVQRDHELAAVRYDQWRIAWACAVDGNVLAVLEPA